MKKLISCTDFVLEQTKKSTENMKLGGVAEALHLINEYARFLKLELNIGMFVPAVFEDGKWIVLEEPLHYTEFTRKETNKYQQAKDKVLFKDCKYKGEDEKSYFIYFPQFSKEDTEYSHYNYTCVGKKDILETFVGYEVTDNALKQIAYDTF